MRRVICIGLALLLAVIVGRDAALAHWRSAATSSVPRLLADDPALHLRVAENRLADPASLHDDVLTIQQAAIALLRQTPLDASAMRKLAVIENQRRPGAGQGLVALAEQVSRRDLPIELFLIDAAEQRGDVAATIRHYDHVLSVYPAAKQQLFPQLASELGEPDVRSALVPLASRPWLRDFVLNAADYDVAPAALMDFYTDLSGKIPASELQAGAIRIIKWLQGRNQSAALGAFAGRLPGMAPHAFDQLGFTTTTLDPRLAPLSWEFTQGDAVGTELAGQKLIIRVAPENAGWAASRLTFLEVGAFEVTQTVGYYVNTPRARLEWHVTCLDGTQPPLLQQMLPLENTGVPVVASFSVPAGCPAQFWHLRASADQSQFASLARLAGLALVRR